MCPRFCSTMATCIALLALFASTGCGARETEQQAYPYPAPMATLPTAYPPPWAQPTFSVEQAEPTVIMEYAGSFFGIVVDAELRIVHVEAGGGAERGGLRAGDLLRSIAGVEIRPGDPASLQEARVAAAALRSPPPEPDVPVLFVIERDGATLSLSVASAPFAPRLTPGMPPATATPVLRPYDYF